MTKKTIIISTVLALLLGLSVIIASVAMKNHSDHPRSAQSSTKMDTAVMAANAVTIEKYGFKPSPVKVKKGTTVVWTNKDVAKHNIELDADQPAGGPTASPLMSQGESYSFTFTTVGTFNYHCGPHPYMKGSVEVTES